MNTGKVIVSLAATYNWNLHQFDVKIHFFSVNLKKRYTWMYPIAPRYREVIDANIVCKLKKDFIWGKSITTSLVWKIAEVMIGLSFKQSQVGHTSFTSCTLSCSIFERNSG
jgi:uncharacterized protein YdeI (YjbR/CyaY-like superfamily)